MHSVVAVNVWRFSSTQNWAHDSSLEIYLCLLIIWLIKKVIWPFHLGEKMILPRSLQRCINPPEANDVFDISPKPWNLCKNWKRFFLLGQWLKKTSLNFVKFIFSCSETQFEEKPSLMCGEWLVPWNDFLTNHGDLMFDDTKWNHTFWYPLRLLYSDISHPIANPSSVGEEFRVLALVSLLLLQLNWCSWWLYFRSSRCLETSSNA